MSIEAVLSAFRAMGLNQGEKLVLLVLADHADEHFECWPSKERLAAHTGMSVRAIYSAIQGLQKRGMLTMEHRMRPNGTRSTNLYQLHLELYQSAKSADGGKRRQPSANTARTIGKNRHQPSAQVAEQNLSVEPISEPSRVRASEPMAHTPPLIQGETGRVLFTELTEALTRKAQKGMKR